MLATLSFALSKRTERTEMETKHTHLEPDLHAAAFMLTKGFPLIRLERVGRRFAFLFGPEAHEAAQEYRNSGTVVARDYAQALKQIKDALYSTKFTESAKFEEEFSGNGNGEDGQQYSHSR